MHALLHLHVALDRRKATPASCSHWIANPVSSLGHHDNCCPMLRSRMSPKSFSSHNGLAACGDGDCRDCQVEYVSLYYCRDCQVLPLAAMPRLTSRDRGTKVTDVSAGRMSSLDLPPRMSSVNTQVHLPFHALLHELQKAVGQARLLTCARLGTTALPFYRVDHPWGSYCSKNNNHNL